ncbi:MAG TPA: substrate-binding domain-containing protein [Phycisphaeraceae bacterium]
MSTDIQKLRPAQRVEQFLASQAAKLRGKPHQRLPSARQLAQELDVSPRTVATVYREFSKRGLLRTRVGDGTFLMPESAAQSPGGAWRIGMSIPRLPQGSAASLWNSLLYGGILDAAASLDPPAMVLPLARDNDDDRMLEQVIHQRDHIDGLILFPHPRMQRILASYAEAGRPVVCLNPPSVSSTTDFVSSDYFQASRRLGQAWRASGRSRVLYLVSGSLERSVSSQLRLSGLTVGLGSALGAGCAIWIESTAGPSVEDGAQAMRRVLASQPPPDAVYCAGDFLALGVLDVLNEHGLKVPEQVSVVGGTGYDLSGSAQPMLTRCHQPLPEISSALVQMLRHRLEHPGSSVPGLFLPLPFIGGSTTLPEENQVLWQDDSASE